MRCCDGCRLLQTLDVCTWCGGRTSAYEERSEVLFGPRPAPKSPFLRRVLTILFALGGVLLCRAIAPPVAGWVASGMWCACVVAVSGLFSLDPPAALQAQALPPEPRTPLLVGTARALRAPLEEGALIRYQLLRDDVGVFARILVAVDVVIELTATGEPVLLTGVLHVAGRGTPLERSTFGRWAKHLSPLGPLRSEQHALRAGQLLEVVGTGREEQVSDGYRERTMRVLRGTREAPLFVRRH